MTFRFDSDVMGYPAIEQVLPAPASLSPSLLPISPGFIAEIEDPVWGPGEAVFARAGAGIRLAGLCVMTPVWDATNLCFNYNMTEAPGAATVGIGRPLFVYLGNVAITTGQYGWFLETGRYPINGSVTFPTADVGLGRAAGAGQVTPTLAAGAQILNARVITPSTNTVVTAGSGVTGDNKINVNSTAGFFPGVYVSGTGVGAAAICSGVDTNGKTITVTVVNSATVTGNVTATYNNATIFYPVVELNRAFGQGQIL